MTVGNTEDDLGSTIFPPPPVPGGLPAVSTYLTLSPCSIHPTGSFERPSKCESDDDSSSS